MVVLKAMSMHYIQVMSIGKEVEKKMAGAWAGFRPINDKVLPHLLHRSTQVIGCLEMSSCM
jgi:hypothetical protein